MGGLGVVMQAILDGVMSGVRRAEHGWGEGCPFLTLHPAKIPLHSCWAVGDVVGMHRVGIRGYVNKLFRLTILYKREQSITTLLT